MAMNLNYSAGETSSEDESEYLETQKLDLSYSHLNAESLHNYIKEMYPNAGSGERQHDILKLALRSNSLTYLPDATRSLRNLVSLDLSDNLLTALPAFFGTAFPHLAVLELRNNLLAAADLPKDVSGLAKSLKSLNLSGNRLTVIPPQLFELTGLRDLRLGGNEIESIQPEIKSLKKLRFLYLGGNLLKKVPKEICHLEKLKALILCDNKLESLPDCICRLKNLRYLQLYSNKLTTLPNGLIFLNSLTELSLRDNPLIVRFVKEIDVQVSSLLELSARTIKAHRIPYTSADLPRGLVSYLSSAQQCVNPKCCGVYFESRVEHIKFVDFCGKYRIPLMQYLCSVNCRSDRPAVLVENSTEQMDKMKRVLLG